jgi:uncharacterized protein
MATERTVTCPGCRQLAVYSEANRWRPFCSARCRGVDLGAWASEQFRVPAETPPEDGGHTSMPDTSPPRLN